MRTYCASRCPERQPSAKSLNLHEPLLQGPMKFCATCHQFLFHIQTFEIKTTYLSMAATGLKTDYSVQWTKFLF